MCRLGAPPIAPPIAGACSANETETEAVVIRFSQNNACSAL